MSRLVSNHILYKHNSEIVITHTRPFIETNECILIMNCNEKTEFVNILLAYQCCEMNKSVITMNSKDNILDFVRLLGYTSIKIFEWKNNKLNYLDSRIM